MGATDATVVAQPLAPSDVDLPKATQEILEKGKRSWLKNTEVCDMLLNYTACNLRVAKEPPCKPPGGSLFLFDRKAVRFFRKDNHNWRKKADGKTVRETHEKLKVDNVDMLNCYYAHADRQDGLQRRCYWLLDSEDDIVLVHYLNIAQRQQPSKSCSHMLNEDAISQRRSEDKGSSSPSDPDMSATSDPDYAPTLGMPPAAPQMKHSSALEAEAANSQDMPTVTSEAYMPFLPSMSMEGFFAGIDGKPSNDRLGLEGPLRSNIAVQELLQSWEDEQNVEPSLLQRAQGNWQKGQMSSAHGSPKLQNQLAAASHSLSLIEEMHPGSSNQWSAEARPPVAAASQRNLDDSRSCTYPSAYMQPASVPLRHVDTSSQLQQQQLPPLPQRCSKPPNRFLAQTQSAPPTGSLDYLTGGASTHLRQAASNGLASDGLDGNQLADYIGLSRSANTFGQQSGPTFSQLGAGCQQSYSRSSHSPQLQGSFSPVSSVGLSSQTALVQSGSFSLPRSSGRPQPMVQNAFASHQGLASGLHSRPQSPFGMSLGMSSESNSDRLLHPKSAFPLTLQSSLQAAFHRLPKPLQGQGQRQKEPAAYHASPFGQPDGPSAFPMPFRSSPYGSNVTTGSSSHLKKAPAPGEATSMDICQSQGLSAASNQPANVRHHPSAASIDQAVHGQAQPRRSFSGSFSQWQNIAPSPFAPSKPDLSSQPSLGASQSLGHHPEALHYQILEEERSRDDTSADVQGGSEPDAMRKAALVLCAQLAQIDKQVLEHIMPQCGHHVSADPQQPGSCSIAQQVHQCEDQLQELEVSSQQLLHASAEQASAVMQTNSGGLSQGGNTHLRQTDLTMAGRPAGKRKMVRRLSDSGSSNYPLFDVLECGPGWDFTQGGAKVLVAASGLDEKQMKEASSHLHVMFDRTEVAATMLWPGVMRCNAPPHAAGSVRLCLTLGDGRPCSKAVSFDYKEALHAGPSSSQRRSADLTDRDLQLQLLQALLQGQPSRSSTPLNALPFSGMAPGRVGVMTGTGPMTGLLLDDNPGPSSNRAQLLQALFKLELEGQMPKAEPLHRLPSQAEYASGRLCSPAALNSLPQQGLPMLHLVSALGYDWACTTLMDAGASVHLQDKSGLTALHWAASRGREACVAALLVKGADPTCQSHTFDGNLGCTSADMASSAGHTGIAAVLAEISLVHALSKAQTGRLPASSVSLLDCQMAQQRPATSSSSDHSLQRKRSRMEQPLPEGLLPPPPSQLISSARDPMTPNVNIVLRMPSAASQQGVDSSADTAYQRLTHTLAGQFRGGVGLHQNPPASKGVGEGGPAATVAAAKQAVAVLEQQWQRQDQQSGTSGVRQAKRKQRDQVALQRLSDSFKMWTTLKKLAEAELADSTNQAQDSVTRRFLGLAPRVARLNDAVRFGLLSGSCGEAAAEGDAAAEAAADEQGTEMGGDARSQESLPQSPQRGGLYLPSHTVKVADEIKGPVVQGIAGNANDAALSQAVQHIEAMAGKADASAQYERVMRAVKSICAQPAVRRVMPALHSY